MGKKRKHLSHEEIWDDSALLNSWDAALQEYQLYHSIHARGERVEDVLKEAEASEEAATKDELDVAGLSSDTVNGPLHPDDVEDGEIEDDPISNGSLAATDVKAGRVELKENAFTNQQIEGATAAPVNDSQHAQASKSMPSMLVNGVQDEGLKNLMMSWYYAGYYTGLYECRQRSGNATADVIENTNVNP